MGSGGRVANLSEVAEIYGVHRNTVSSWLKKGCPFIHRADKARGIEWQLDTAAVARWRIDQAVEDSVGDMEQVTEAEARARKLRADATISELEAAQKKGELGSIEEFEQQTREIALEVRARLQQLVPRVAPLLMGATSETDAKSILKDEIHQALTVLAEEFGSE